MKIQEIFHWNHQGRGGEPFRHFRTKEGVSQLWHFYEKSSLSCRRPWATSNGSKGWKSWARRKGEDGCARLGVIYFFTRPSVWRVYQSHFITRTWNRDFLSPHLPQGPWCVSRKTQARLANESLSVGYLRELPAWFNQIITYRGIKNVQYVLQKYTI